MSDDVDPQTLQRDLDRIKSAMGIAERSENAPEQWLLFGVFVAVGSALSQYVVLQRLPGYWFAVIWLGLVAVGGTVVGYYTDTFEPTPADKPNVAVQVFAPYAAGFPLWAAVTPFLADLGYEEETALMLGVVLVLLGVGYVVAANSLRAYRIRARDRRAFALGGVLLVALGVAVPTVDVLHTWGYAAFGGTYLAYAVASYGVLTRT
ncbi:hypothetical protein [Halobacterium yunchengense]|uniref:hypothetical protein n=1 Tax=Halobacterium yunchengense TaxID=3108497 RepID=UPI003008B273